MIRFILGSDWWICLINLPTGNHLIISKSRFSQKQDQQVKRQTEADLKKQEEEVKIKEAEQKKLPQNSLRETGEGSSQKKHQNQTEGVNKVSWSWEQAHKTQKKRSWQKWMTGQRVLWISLTEYATEKRNEPFHLCKVGPTNQFEGSTKLDTHASSLYKNKKNWKPEKFWS